MVFFSSVGILLVVYTAGALLIDRAVPREAGPLGLASALCFAAALPLFVVFFDSPYVAPVAWAFAWMGTVTWNRRRALLP